MPSTPELVKFFRRALINTGVIVGSKRLGEITIRSKQHPERCYVTTRAAAGANIEAFESECRKARTVTDVPS